MARLLLLALALMVAGCTGGGDDAPEDDAPRMDAAAVSYAVGDSWTYRVEEADSQRLSFTNFTGEREENGRRLFEFEVQESGDGPGVPLGRVDLVVAGTLAVAETRQVYPRIAIEYDPPLNVLSPAEDHAYEGVMRMRADAIVNERQVNATIEYLGPERVVVPAGEFDAHHFRTTFGGAGGSTTDVWFSMDAKMPVKTMTKDRLEVLVSHRVG